MMRTVQLAIADAGYRAALREALSRSGPWQVECADVPDPSPSGVLVLDEPAFERLALPLAHPERVVLIAHQDPAPLAQAWDAGIVSVVSIEDSLATAVLAVMAAALRVHKGLAGSRTRAISPTDAIVAAPISPENQNSRSKRCKIR
jgi:hypothetical protein